ncbi:hypothetical protein BHE74_00014249, partial [Ensete ventricosum]
AKPQEDEALGRRRRRRRRRFPDGIRWNHKAGMRRFQSRLNVKVGSSLGRNNWMLPAFAAEDGDRL